MFVPMDSTVTSLPTLWAHTNKFLGIFFNFGLGTSLIFTLSSLSFILTLFSFSLSLAHGFSNHFHFCALVVFFNFVDIFCSLHSRFVLAFAYGYNNWLMFCKVGLVFALHSLCFGLYL
jgi:hypothetical protein